MSQVNPNHMPAEAPFLRKSSGVHPQVDFDALELTYPDSGPDIWNVGSASDLIPWQRLRHWYDIEGPDAIPCDVFVWGKGVPPDLRMTRVGGTPFLPKRIPWPTVEESIAQFLCQFDFRDSKDLVGQTVARELPGDILLVFVKARSSLLSGDAGQFRFIWVSANESDDDVIAAEDIPVAANPFEFVTAWGARFRTFDIPSKWEAAFQIPDDASRGRTWILPVYWATKIGGVPYHSQEVQRQVPSDFLCQLISIQPSHGTRWPWVNVEQPLELNSKDNGIHHKSNSLSIGDLGELSFYLRKNGQISVDAACG